MNTGANTRNTALEILMKYEKEGRKLTPLLISVLEKKDGIDRRDKAFVQNLVEGTVERLITLDWIIDQVSRIRTDRMKPVIRMILRLGAYQLIFLDGIPDRAAVNESVELAKKRHLNSLAPFVNGVLRSVARYRDKGIIYPDPETEYSYPDRIAALFKAAYGEEKALSMMKAGIGGSRLYLRVNRCRIDTDALIERLKKEEAVTVRKVSDPLKNEMLPYTLEAEGRLIPSASACFAEGLYSVQDLSSQLAMYDLCGQVLDYIKRTNPVNITILDLCAAPGGKTCFVCEMLSEIAEGKPGYGFKIKSFDLSGNKLTKIKENLERTKITHIECEEKDASEYDPSLSGKADVIIADLPCSGLGVTGRKVDIKYRVGPDDIKELCELQRKILTNASGYLKSGGILLYSVCTVTEQETSGQIEFVEKAGLHKVSERLFLQGIDPCDGFYYSIWRKP